MRIGMIGCGKLGLMVALTIEHKGHEVKGFDVSDAPKRYLESRSIPFQEDFAEELLEKTKMEMVSLEELCAWADILFLAPHTPHAPVYEGVTRLLKERADFDYSYLKQCVQAVSAALTKPTICAVISTVLPGTIEREILPLISENFRFVYSPQFIAMGTVYQDFLCPEFWLIGAVDQRTADELAIFFQTINFFCPALKTDVRTAEGIKVFYNTFITAKTVLANLYGEMSQRCGMNVDDIFKAVSFSDRRLLSPRYLKAGMGDGGGCHPRDNIALSWLADHIGLSFNFFDALMTARERHTEWLADVIEKHCAPHLRLIILGKAFKPETNIETGSPAILLSNLLTERGVGHSIAEDLFDLPKAVYFIGTQHERYQHYQFPHGSVVIDPFRYIPNRPGVTVIRIGEGHNANIQESVAA